MIYKLQHTFKPVVLVPLLAIYPNHEFIFDKDKHRFVKTSDGVIAQIKSEERIHFLSPRMQEIVSEVYKTDVLSFGRKWYQAMDINTMGFLYLTLEKHEERNTEDDNVDM